MKYYKSSLYKLEFVHSKDSGMSYGEHNHISIYAVGLVIDGKITLKRQLEERECEKDDLYIIPPYEVHAMKACEGIHTIVTLCIGEEYLDGNELEECKRILVALANPLMQDKVMNQEQLQAFCDAMEAVYHMHRMLEYSNPDWITTTQKRIEMQPEQEMTLDDLAASIFVSKYYFVRKFKDKVGLTPHNFLIQNRIRKAQHLLAHGGSIMDTAMEMGFYDQSHFIKYFKKIVGITPSEYIVSVEHIE